MARISAAQRKSNKETYDALVLEIFLTQGWDFVTYDNLAKQLGISKSTLQNYYPNADAFAAPLKGRIFPVLIKNLEFNGSVQAFIDSWEKAIQENKLFRNVIQMFLENALKRSTSPMAREGILRLETMLASTMSKEQANHAMKVVLGSTFYYMSIQKPDDVLNKSEREELLGSST